MEVPVTSVREFLEETIRGGEQLDELLHHGLERLRTKAYALKLAEDPEFHEEIARLQKKFEMEGSYGTPITTEALSALLEAERDR